MDTTFAVEFGTALAGLGLAYVVFGGIVDWVIDRRSRWVPCPACHGVGYHAGLSERDLAEYFTPEGAAEMRASGMADPVSCGWCYGASRVTLNEAGMYRREAREFVARATRKLNDREAVLR